MHSPRLPIPKNQPSVLDGFCDSQAQEDFRIREAYLRLCFLYDLFQITHERLDVSFIGIRRQTRAQRSGCRKLFDQWRGAMIPRANTNTSLTEHIGDVVWVHVVDGKGNDSDRTRRIKNSDARNRLEISNETRA